MNRHVLGMLASYELHPLIQSSVAMLLGLGDGSGLVQPGLVYSAGDEVDLVAGAAVPWGRRPNTEALLDASLGSEFGTCPSFFYLQLKLFF